jgi:nitrile hydratase beta subunit
LNGVHDIGGMDGFGAIHRDPDEPVFHEPWESRVFGIALTAVIPTAPLDAFRHRLERLDPVKYLTSSYYERWLAAIEGALVENGTLSLDEIENRTEQFGANPDTPMPHGKNPGQGDRFHGGRPGSQRKIRQKPRYAVGDRIVTRNLNPVGHTRLPRYARGKHGVIVAHHGAHVFPDSNAHGMGENPQHLYTVRFAMRELWGDSSEPNESLLIDLWESYLDSEKARSKSSTSKSAGSTQKIMARKLPRVMRLGAGRGTVGKRRGSGKTTRKSR